MGLVDDTENIAVYQPEFLPEEELLEWKCAFECSWGHDLEKERDVNF